MTADDAAPPGRDPALDAAFLDAMDSVYRFAKSLTRDAAAADDLVQETYLRAFRFASSFIPGSDARRWLFTICRNAFLRGEERDQRYTPLDDAEGEVLRAVQSHNEWHAEGLDEALMRLDLSEAITDAIARLPETFRVAVVLVDLEGCAYADAAELLGVPVGTVRSRLFRGRRLLQESLIAFARDAGLSKEPE
ncbi:MAG: sigma-70 family RNA polymerase sigma factor [Gemmatimonadetes bacterium]|nr:sigma-70 family RNA polymerase sigma factor [Gemmatimonadota bacterium]